LLLNLNLALEHLRNLWWLTAVFFFAVYIDYSSFCCIVYILSKQSVDFRMSRFIIRPSLIVDLSMYLINFYT
jgi:hypothetical protein